MLKIGITGGIGSGKSTVCRLFEKLEIPVYYADDRAKLLMHEDAVLRQQLIEVFGSNVFRTDGTLDRGYLSGIVFKDPRQLTKLNAIVHPAVFEDAKAWQTLQAQKGCLYTLKEAALLYETGSYKSLDKIIVVTAPESVRIQRVMARDKIGKEAVLARINKQMAQAEKVKRAVYVVQNLAWETLNIQVSEIDEHLRYLAKVPPKNSSN